MPDPLEYQTPLPTGLNLRLYELPDGVRISRETVGRVALWREALIPGTALVVMPSIAIYSAWWAWRYWNTAQAFQVYGRVAFAVIIPILMVRVVRDAWQNAGIVTEIAITNATLYWRKQTLWGSSEHFWPLATVSRVSVDPLNRVLKVHRHRGTPLGAFAFHPMDEMNFAAHRLNIAIQAARARPASKTNENQ